MKSDESVSVRLFGGLGNQIFQYMAGKSLAMALSCSLCVDTSWLKSGYSHEKSSIKEFDFYSPDYEYGQAHKNTLHLYSDRLATVAARTSTTLASWLRINAPKNVGYEDLSRLNRGVQLRGYYQSPQYFLKLVELGAISKESFELLHPSVEFKKKSARIPRVGFIAVHVRGGDYLQKNSDYRELGGDYYESALNSFRSEIKDLPKWVFTDDEPHARKVLASIPDLNFLESESLTAAENMILMSKAHGIVGANSTFSYWSSLISRQDSSIIVPKNWVKSKSQPEDFFPAEWRLI
jgi:hypothetical protein